MKVVFTEDARLDVSDLYLYLQEQREELADQSAQSLVELEGILNRNPRAFPEKHPGIRVASILKYSVNVFYRVKDDALVIAVVHSSRGDSTLRRLLDR
ncbi:MAG: type II toxin-antitoxin system RelE/ParE family toxin [Bacteroidia bacterium]|nr:type II toxin-antitoxin system RelE/ParE family toxin [Bacteroidia bacterium]